MKINRIWFSLRFVRWSSVSRITVCIWFRTKMVIWNSKVRSIVPDESEGKNEEIQNVSFVKNLNDPFREFFTIKRFETWFTSVAIKVYSFDGTSSRKMFDKKRKFRWNKTWRSFDIRFQFKGFLRFRIGRTPEIGFSHSATKHNRHEIRFDFSSNFHHHREKLHCFRFFGSSNLRNWNFSIDEKHFFFFQLNRELIGILSAHESLITW